MRNTTLCQADDTRVTMERKNEHDQKRLQQDLSTTSSGNGSKLDFSSDKFAFDSFEKGKYA